VSFVRRIYSKPLLSALDFGPERVAVLIGEKKPDGTFHILGAGDSEARGVKDGEIVHLGDAVESAVEAVRAAEKAGGIKVQTLYINYDDPKVESVKSRGSKILKGEGEIQGSDIQEACEMAERLAARFEKKAVYSKAISFLIDDRDTVSNPSGVFGRKLEALVHLIQASSAGVEKWQRFIERCNVKKGSLVFSAWSTAYGLLPKADRERKRLIVNLGRDFSKIFIFAQDRIMDYQCLSMKNKNLGERGAHLLKEVKELLDKHPDSEQVLATGDFSKNEQGIQCLKELSIPFCPSGPLGVDTLTSPESSSLAGLLFVADDLEKKRPILRRDKGLLTNVKEKAVTFINDYF